MTHRECAERILGGLPYIFQLRVADDVEGIVREHVEQQVRSMPPNAQSAEVAPLAKENASAVTPGLVDRAEPSLTREEIARVLSEAALQRAVKNLPERTQLAFTLGFDKARILLIDAFLNGLPPEVQAVVEGGGE